MCVANSLCQRDSDIVKQCQKSHLITRKRLLCACAVQIFWLAFDCVELRNANRFQDPRPTLTQRKKERKRKK